MAVLIVEDEESLRRAMQIVLGRAFELKLAGGAQEALELGHQGLDLVITDYSMPLKDGVTLARELRGRGYLGPVLIVTALPDAPSIQLALAEKVVTRLLTKPWTPASLLAEARSLVGAGA
jgi:DNA-binding response OmpR family regulator